jgi:methylated-DNA-[protein]-cysteine S-methyltransferase
MRTGLTFEVPTPLPCGPAHVTVTDRGVLAMSFVLGDAASVGNAASGMMTDGRPDRREVAVRAQLAEYFAGRRRDLSLPIDWSLTCGAQRAVLQTLWREVGFGRTITYGELAGRSHVFDDAPAHFAAREVGAVMAANPLWLVVPCHRVVAANGIGGYGGGLHAVDVKRWLLTHEGALPPMLEW